MNVDRVTANVWVFDLDNTLYSRDCNLFAQIDVKMKTFISNLLGVNTEKAHYLQKHYFRTHGTTLRGLMENHHIDPQQFLDFVHDIDLSPVLPNPELNEALYRIRGRKLIFTNGSEQHAENVLNRLGIRLHFEGIFDIIASGYIPKPDYSAYETFVIKHDVKPSSAVMLEDIARNLLPAHDMGMTTVWIRSDHDHSAIGAEGDHIDFIIEDLTEWLTHQTKMPSR